jgi:hypothetical protein
MSCEKLCNGSHRSPVFGVGHGDVAMSSEADRGRCGGLWAAARWTPRVAVHDTGQRGVGPRPGPPGSPTSDTAKPIRRRRLAGVVMGLPTTGKRHLKNNRSERLFRQTSAIMMVSISVWNLTSRDAAVQPLPHTRGSGRGVLEHRAPAPSPRDFRRGSGTYGGSSTPRPSPEYPAALSCANASDWSPVRDYPTAG